ncbi:DUF2169 domain-containing protein [uncultured Variovorax sp.]|uniref:DUF2169 domain-containing protein n=1 Tax=uncultured Variovorax sp. TaxID=114708 RepID=UPI0025DD4147|nr:DUF2169 domain-containing protein [uncultured Variovorax sp.]
MKTIKPFRLSIITRPFRRRRRDFLGVSVFAMASLAPEPLLMPDQDLWKLAADEIGPGNVLDMGVPKIEPEWLVSGYAYTAHQEDKTLCAAQAVFHGQAKSLLVSGDRYWLDGRATAAQPFERLRLDWAHAYGGPGEPENPEGIGSFDETINGVHTRRLPNVELPGARQDVPGRRIVPAGFGAVPPDRPQRLALMGRAYDQQWLQHDYPGFADDMDWRYFNAAPADQRLAGQSELPPGAAYELWNMHPRQPVMRGRLPDWHARCFASFQKDGGALSEISLRLSTAWFFPHAERVILIWHGAGPIAEDDAADVKHIMPALELRGQPRPLDHYQHVLQQRIDPAKAVLVLRDSDLVPKAVMGPWAGEQMPDIASFPLVRNLRAGRQREHERLRARLLEQGLDPEQYLPPLAEPDLQPPASMDDLPDFAEKADRALEQMRETALARGAEGRAQAVAHGMPAAAQPDVDIPPLSQMDPHKLSDAIKASVDKAMTEVASRTGKPVQRRFDPDSLLRDLARLEQSAARERRTPPTSDEVAESARLREQAARSARMGHLHGAHLLEPAPPASSLRSRRLRRRLEAAADGERRFAGMNFVGADLSGLDLRGADFTEANLEDVDFSDARLDGCNFTRAVLARAKLVRASLTEARLDEANLGGARCESANFTGASFEQTRCSKTIFHSCVLAKASFSQSDLFESEWLRCDARGSRWEQMAMVKLALEDMAFDNAAFEQVSWVECSFKGASFVRAALSACAFVTVDAHDGVDFTEASLVTCSFVHGCSLVQAVFCAASLRQCGLRGAMLVGADFAKARLEGCDLSDCDLRRARLEGLHAGESLFVRADFREASLRGANLIDANLSKADLRFASLQDANLFRTDVSQAAIDGSTTFIGAYTQGAKTLPARSTEQAR